MKKIDSEYINCPVRTVLDRFGDKWSVLVILNLDLYGKMRFNNLQRAIGDVSQRMLTVTVRRLEEDGLLERTLYPEVPPRVEYKLTELGESLTPLIQNLFDWAKENREKIVLIRKKSNVNFE